ncbi:flagellar hook-associated protein FlgL [Ignavibacteria bacterium]|nr:hypothetical protein [Bacteroidota bacterium]
MRITMNSQATIYQRNIFDLQERTDAESVRISTGKNYQRLSESPKSVVDIQRLSSLIDRNSLYRGGLAEAGEELTHTESVLENFSYNLSEVRRLALESQTVANSDKLPVLGQQVYQLLQDMISTGNANYGGKYLFGGTKTTDGSITPTPPAVSTRPFELTQSAPNPSNPSGLSVVFQGNNDDRIINRTPAEAERINVRSADVFGGSGTEVFDTVVELYNVLSFRADGSLRTSSDPFTHDESAKTQNLVRKLSNNMSTITVETGKVGYRSARFDAIAQQIDEDNIRLKEFRSQQEDTNIPEAALKLKREQNALDYSLKIGSQLFTQSLFDFLR